MLKSKTPLWFLDETYTYFILQRPLEEIKEADFKLTVDGRTLRLEVEKLGLDESLTLPRSVDTRGLTWALNEGVLPLMEIKEVSSMEFIISIICFRRIIHPKHTWAMKIASNKNT
jgi:hypothetical protein